MKSDNIIWIWTRKGSRGQARNWRKSMGCLFSWAIYLMVLAAAFGFFAQNTNVSGNRATTSSRVINVDSETDQCELTD